MQVQELLLKTLDDLTKENFKRFKWFLKLGVLEGCEPIPQAQLEDANQEEVVTKMTESYGEDSAVKVTIEILKKQSLNNLAEKLRDSFSEKMTSTSSSTSVGTTSVPPAATMSAQAGSVIIVPMLNSSTTGSWNINVNEP